VDDCGHRHPYTTREHDGERVEIDVEIAPLVEFDGPEAEKFINLVAARAGSLSRPTSWASSR
jgi:hypothetical protein